MKNLILFPAILISILFLSCSNNQDDNMDSKLKADIKNAKITDFKGFYFVGKYNGFPSIYFYDAKTEKSKKYWYKDGEKVVDLHISNDRKTAYFITMRKQRLRSSVPAVERGKLYRIEFETNKVEMITQLQESIQVIAFWEDSDRFTLITNSIDKTIASYVNKNVQTYNKFGKLLSDNTEIYDLTKDGFPVTKFPTPEFSSPNGLFAVLSINDTLIVRSLENSKNFKTTFTDFNIKQIGWAEDNRNLILLISQKADIPDEKYIEESKSSALIIYDLLQKQVAKSFTGERYKRFVLIGDFLIFDSVIDKQNVVQLIKLSDLTQIKTIKLNGGCALRHIPQN